MFGAQEKLWFDALPDTTNDPDGIRTHDPLTMSRKRYQFDIYRRHNHLIFASCREACMVMRGITQM